MCRKHFLCHSFAQIAWILGIRKSDNRSPYNSLPTNGMNNRLYIYFAEDEDKY